ncbi:MAG TPA: response regulator [Clostridiales bacterium]|nr:response regulator [Clostridiales bacterium]HQP70339.1 response regulator [Clostridiales bacterium]
MNDKADKLLIIDDSPKNIQVVANFLQNEGYDLSFATDGREAMQILSKETFDLILLDVVMPLIDGFQICREISSNSNYKDIPILFLTVKTDPESIIKGFESGGVDYITKPFNPNELLARIRTHLRLKKIQKQFKDNNAKLIEEISLRQKAEKQLKNMNVELEYKVKERTKQIYRLAAIIDQLYESVIITNRDGVIEYVNKAFEADSGFTSEEVIGDMPRFLEKGKFSESFYDEIWRTIKSGRTWRGSFSNLKKDGTPFEEEITVVPIVNNGSDPDGYFSLKRDVSNQKKLERQLINAQKMEAIGTLAGGIAHDFNNILTAIIGYSEIVKHEIETKKYDCPKISEVLSAAHRAKDLVNQILILSRRSEIEKKHVRPDLIIKEAVKLIRSSVPSSIEISTSIENCQSTVMADPSQIHQIAMNLCTNAYQAIGDHNGKIDIVLKPVRLDENKAAELGIKAGEYLLFSVEDDGKGIEDSIKDKIFEPYFTTKNTGEGTGLGLAIVHGIVSDMKGSVSVYSSLKKTVFTIYMPCSSDRKADEEVPIPSDIPVGCEQILFVDDEEKIADLGKILLEDLGYKVTKTTDPTEALKTLQSGTSGIRFAVADFTMPVMSGIELADRIYTSDPEIKFIITSGIKRFSDSELSGHRNIIGFIQKPFTKKELGLKIRQAIDGIK